MPAQIGFLRTLLAVFLPVVLLPGAAAPHLHANEPLDHFERRVRPLLVDKCYSCHSEESGKRKGGLWLDRRDGWQQGGDSGPAVIPGEPDTSLLIQAVRRENDELVMPPDDSLNRGEIAILERWVADGAPDPREGSGRVSEIDFEAALEHWAFRPMLDPVPPSGGSDAETAIDRFILRELTDAGLELSAPADRRTLIRRISIVLTGLPPTLADTDAFLADTSEEAFARVVDRLLASPHFGERWGRMWLDLARFADSNGLDENLAHGHAWRYRDYVVEAWNSDKPYDQFLREQLAGDLLPPSGVEQADLAAVVATGFLSLGPKMLAEQDKDKLAIDIVDEQLDVAMQAFQGMTVGCARCHDHKFDPIPTTDYYAIAGIFRSTQTMEHFNHVSSWREADIATAAELESRKVWEAEKKVHATAHLTVEADVTRALDGQWRRGVDGALLAAQANRDRWIHVEAEDAVATNLHADTKQWGSPGVEVLHTHQSGPQFAEWEITAPVPGSYRLSVRYAAQESRPMALALDGVVLETRALAKTTGGWLPADQRFHDVIVLDLGPAPHRLRLEREGAIPHLDRLRLVAVDQEGRPDLVVEPGVSLPAEVIIGWGDFLARPGRADDPFFAPWLALARLSDREFPDEFTARATLLRARIGAQKNALSPLIGSLLDGFPPRDRREFAGRMQAFLAAIDPAEEPEKTNAPKKEDKKPDRLTAAALEEALRGPDGPYAIAMQKRLELCPPDLAARLEASQQRGKEIAKREPAMLPRAMAVGEGSPRDLPVHIRGSHLSLAAHPTPRGALSITDPLVPPVNVPEGVSGRRELAAWMLHPEHPLTARVIVNRVWQGLFGEGLVRTPSNFGLRGDTPSHPELLDRLARDLIADGWSLKRLTRRLVLTRVWQQTSGFDARGETIDPENRLLWRQTRRRLEAEWVRDALLAVSGQLDPAVGGTLLSTRNRGYVTNDQSRNQARYDAPRRSIYLPVIRNAMYELFSAFDFNDPSVPVDRRSATVVAHQALFFLNAPLVIGAAQALAERSVDATSDAASDTASDRDRIDQVVRLAWGRPPTVGETDRMLAFLARAVPMIESTPDPPAGDTELEIMQAEAIAAASLEFDPMAKDGSSPEDDLIPPPTPQELAWQALAQAILAASEFTYFD